MSCPPCTTPGFRGIPSSRNAREPNFLLKNTLEACSTCNALPASEMLYKLFRQQQPLRCNQSALAQHQRHGTPTGALAGPRLPLKCNGLFLWARAAYSTDYQRPSLHSHPCRALFCIDCGAQPASTFTSRVLPQPFPPKRITVHTRCLHQMDLAQNSAFDSAPNNFSVLSFFPAMLLSNA